MTARPITYRTREGVRVMYRGPANYHNGRTGTVQKHRRDGMLQIIFDVEHNRCSEYYMAWPSSLTRMERMLHHDRQA